MAIESSAILPSDSLEEFRIQFNLLVTDVDGITGGNTFVSSIIFEGATADAYETTLTVVDPTADRTITLPNVTGTVLTTANSDAGSYRCRQRGTGTCTVTHSRIIGGYGFIFELQFLQPAENV